MFLGVDSSWVKKTGPNSKSEDKQRPGCKMVVA